MHNLLNGFHSYKGLLLTNEPNYITLILNHTADPLTIEVKEICLLVCLQRGLGRNEMSYRYALEQVPSHCSCPDHKVLKHVNSMTCR